MSQIVPHVPEQLVLPAFFTPTGLDLPHGVTYEKWEALGNFLGHVERTVQWWVGDWVNYGEREYGEKYSQALDETGLAYSTISGAAWVCREIESCRRRQNLSFSHHQEVASLEPDDQDEWLDRAEAEQWTRNDLRREIRERRVETPPLPVDRYRCIVLDPPWPVEKIVREVRAKQGPALDYPVMQLEQIAALPIGELAAEDGCHIYLWVTHKLLPDALGILEGWGANYECVLTWVKPTGMTPYSWMRTTEHVLFARIGSLQLDRMGLPLDFAAPVQGHSRKPEAFFDVVRQASPGPRLEMFARSEREGFDVWGNEVADAA